MQQQSVKRDTYNLTNGPDLIPVGQAVLVLGQVGSHLEHLVHLLTVLTEIS